MHRVIEYACISRRGKARTCNQDAVLAAGSVGYGELQHRHGAAAARAAAVFGVFDGMGGGEHGEIASLLAAQAFAAADPSLSADRYFSNAIRTANERICQYASNHGCRNMGTTAAAVLFQGGRFMLCSIGDSKILRLRGGKLEQLSADHVIRLPGRKKTVLTQHLGIPPNVMTILPYLAEGGLRRNDLFVICSDGIFPALTESRIRSLAELRSAAAMETGLLELAEKSGSTDDISLIVCRPRIAWVAKRAVEGKGKSKLQNERKA